MSPSLLFLNRDARILDLIRAGDEQALVMLYQDHRRSVTSYVLRNSGSMDDADEMLQEAVIILWERVRMGTFEYRSKLGTFIIGTVRNLWARRLAKQRRETPIPEDLDPPSEQLDPLDDMIHAEASEAVRVAMDRVGEQCRKLLLLFYWEGQSMEEIARLLGFANAETAKSKKYQCKKSLQHILKSLMPDG